MLPDFSRRVTFSACLTGGAPGSDLTVTSSARAAAADQAIRRRTDPADLPRHYRPGAGGPDVRSALRPPRGRAGSHRGQDRGILARWRQAGLADSGRFSEGPAWCWATQQGLRQLGYPWTAEPPALSRLARTRAVLACRLWLESVEGSPRSGESWAVEVELTPEPLARTQSILSGLLAQSYSHILYLCSAATIPVVSHAARQLPPEQAARVAVQPVPPPPSCREPPW